METERCPHCGASVKKANFKTHLERIHPKQPGSQVQPKTAIRSTPFFKSHRRRNILVVSLLALAVVGLSFAAASYARTNTQAMHWHPQLSVTINGRPATVAAQIGIDPTLWKDHSLDQYGIGGLSPLHTHDTSGTIHEESNTIRDFTLQQFLAVWGQSIDGSQVLGHPVDPGHRAYIVVDGVQQPPTQDAILRNGEKIQLVCGP